MAAALPELETIADCRRAGALLHPLRLEILSRAREPRSASELSAELGLPRQNLNYHVRELERAGFLRLAESRRRRNLVERRYRATANAYVLAPELLGRVGADAAAIGDRTSAAYLMALVARLQRELGRAAREADERGKRLATLSLEAELRFESAAQRESFAVALRDAVTRAIAEHASAARLADGSPGPGRPFRLVLGCHPIPPDEQAGEDAAPRQSDPTQKEPSDD